MPRLYDHLDLRVRDRAEAHAFFEKISPALGLPHVFVGPEFICYCSQPFPGVGEYLAIVEEKTHTPSATCHALWADSKEAVDRVASVLKEISTAKIEGPEMYYRGHYAVFFDDPSGNRFEVCHREYSYQFDPRIAGT